MTALIIIAYVLLGIVSLAISAFCIWCMYNITVSLRNISRTLAAIRKTQETETSILRHWYDRNPKLEANPTKGIEDIMKEEGKE